LSALAEQLLLPQPTLDGFLFRADAAFDAMLTGSPESLQRAVRRVLEHLGFEVESIVVGYNPSLTHPGQIQRDGARFAVEIGAAYKADARTLGALVAHECCHLLLRERGVPQLGAAEDELHVELAAMLSGLGPLLLHGLDAPVNVAADRAKAPRPSFGYLDTNLLTFAHSFVASSLGVGAVRATRDLRGATALRVRWQLAVASLRPGKPLGFAPPGEVLTACLGRDCDSRLRIPLGKSGVLKCPRCQTERAFDARPTRSVVQSKYRALTSDPKPPVGTLGARWFATPYVARVACSLLPAAALGFGGAQAYAYLSKGGLGAPCRADLACRSEICARESALTWGLPRVLVVDPSLKEGYCSQECRADAECGGMKCGLASNPKAGEKATLQVCTRPQEREAPPTAPPEKP
jgi:hypothetical protein